MDKRTLLHAAPIVYGLLVVVCALFADAALVPVAVVGALLLGLMYVLVKRPEGGRQRSRARR